MARPLVEEFFFAASPTLPKKKYLHLTIFLIGPDNHI